MATWLAVTALDSKTCDAAAPPDNQFIGSPRTLMVVSLGAMTAELIEPLCIGLP